MASKNVAETVEPMLAPVAESNGVELYDVEYLKEGGDMILRLYIDKDGGVDINDCERVSRAAEAVLDARDPIASAYLLEVSSPGIERKLKKDSHYARYTGQRVEVRLFSPVLVSEKEKRKKFVGTLKGLNKGIVTVTDGDGRDWDFPRAGVSLCRLVVF